jgi:hypothetical protein
MMAMSEERREDRAVSVKTVALSALLGVVIVLAIGAMSGAGLALLGGKADLTEGALVVAGALLLGLASLWGLVRLRPWAGTGEPVSPNTRKANNLLLLSGGLGGLLGAALSFGTISSDDPFALFSNSPMSLAIVIPALAVWLLLVPLISWQWHRSVDEHEAGAYRFGGLAGLYLFAFLAPAWWLAARGGLVPAPDTMVIYLIVMAVWCVGWFWRRYR